MQDSSIEIHSTDPSHFDDLKSQYHDITRYLTISAIPTRMYRENRGLSDNSDGSQSARMAVDQTASTAADNTSNTEETLQWQREEIDRLTRAIASLQQGPGPSSSMGEALEYPLMSGTSGQRRVDGRDGLTNELRNVASTSETANRLAAVATPQSVTDRAATPRVAHGTTNTERVSTSEDRAITRDGRPRPRHTLPHCSKFDGDRKIFPLWKSEMINKLVSDGEAIGTSRDQFNYIFACLEMKPKGMVHAYVRLGGNNAEFKPDHFLQYISTIYTDPNEERRAMDRLRELKQSNSESFSTFLPRFEKELANGGGMSLDDRVKINYLEGALNYTLLSTLAATEMPNDWVGYIHKCQTISSKLDGLKHHRGIRLGKENTNEHRSSSLGRNRSPQAIATKAAVEDDNMDWEPTAAVKIFKISDPTEAANLKKDNERLRGKRAKWVDQEELTRRRKAGLCYRCGRTYCRLNICPLSPPNRPNNGTRASAAKPVVTAAVIEESEEDDEISGNE